MSLFPESCKHKSNECIYCTRIFSVRRWISECCWLHFRLSTHIFRMYSNDPVNGSKCTQRLKNGYIFPAFEILSPAMGEFRVTDSCHSCLYLDSTKEKSLISKLCFSNLSPQQHVSGLWKSHAQLFRQGWYLRTVCSPSLRRFIRMIKGFFLPVLDFYKGHS